MGSPIDSILENIALELEKANYITDRNSEANKALHELVESTSARLVDLVIEGAAITKEAGKAVGMQMAGIEAEIALVLEIASKIKQKAFEEIFSRLQFRKEETQQ